MMSIRSVRRVFIVVLFALSTVGLSAETVETPWDLGFGVSTGGLFLAAFGAYGSNFISGVPTLALPLITETRYWTRSGIGFGMEIDNVLFASMQGSSLDMLVYPSIRWRRNVDSLFSVFLVPFSARILLENYDSNDSHIAIGAGEEYWVSNQDFGDFMMTRLGVAWTWRPRGGIYLTYAISSGAGYLPLEFGLTAGISR